VRLAATGREAQHELVKALEKNRFFFGASRHHTAIL
jgi:hypothetical protein